MRARAVGTFVVEIYREQVPFIIMALVGAAMVVVGLVGEILGWWKDTGVMLIDQGVIVSVFGTGITLLLGATRQQVRGIASGVASGNGKLDSANTKLDSANTKLDSANSRLDSANTKLDNLVGGQQTGNQLLAEIRDLLASR